MTGVGNHEAWYNFTAFSHRWQMPQNGNGNFWFSYDYGNVSALPARTAALTRRTRLETHPICWQR